MRFKLGGMLGSGKCGRVEGEFMRVPLTARAQGVAPARDEAVGAGGRAGGG